MCLNSLAGNDSCYGVFCAHPNAGQEPKENQPWCDTHGLHAFGCHGNTDRGHNDNEKLPSIHLFPTKFVRKEAQSQLPTDSTPKSSKVDARLMIRAAVLAPVQRTHYRQREIVRKQLVQPLMASIASDNTHVNFENNPPDIHLEKIQCLPQRQSSSEMEESQNS